MQYSPEIFPAYEQVFTKVHEHLKTAGAADFVRNIFNSGRNARALESATGRLAHQEAAIAGAVDEAAKLRFDKGLAETQLRNAQREAAAVQQQGANAGAAAPSHLGRNLALGAGAAGAAGLGGYYAGKKDEKRTRNLAFGAGAAAGIAAPHMLRGLGQIAQGASATGAFPELQGYLPDASY